MPEIKASPRNRLLGAFADVARNVNDFAAKPFGYDNPPVAMMAGLLGLPAVANTLNELSYGGALGTGSGMTWKPKADTVDAAMTLLPLGATAGKAAVDGGVALARRAAPAIERAVPRVMERGGLSSQLLRDLSQNTVSPATVWHGSPYKFDRFDFSKIGTGEGAQAYGHGGYLAEARGVGESYAKMDSPFAAAGPKGPPATIAALAKIDGGKNPAQYLKDNYASQVKQWGQADVDAAIKSLEGGYLYKVDLPDDAIAKMLDWDKPLSQQHPDVQKAIAPMLAEKRSMYPNLDKDPTGNVLYTMIGGNVGSSAQAQSANTLRQAGIPGIRYLDGGSRGTGAGTSNFVVFPGNEGLLTILERNGQPVNQASGLLAPKFVYPQEQALLTAQKNAALPVEQGGLGLRPDNTPMERAKAMGINVDAYHGTDTEFQFPNRDVFASEAPSIANRYAFRNSDDGLVMPLKVSGSAPTFEHLGANSFRLPPDAVRSRFAAFDPMRINENDLLGRASPGLLGLIGGGTGLGLLGNQWLTDR